MGDHGPGNGSPGVDVEITGGAVQAFWFENNKVAHGGESVGRAVSAAARTLLPLQPREAKVADLHEKYSHLRYAHGHLRFPCPFLIMATTHAVPRMAAWTGTEVKRRVRHLLAWLHLWVGLVVGTVFTLNGVAGSVLVFHPELLRLQHPQLVSHSPRTDPAVLAELVDTWAPKGMRSMDLPQPDLPVYQGFFGSGQRAYFSPEDGRLLLWRSPDNDVLMWLHEWHVALLSHEVGKQVLGVIGWISLGLLLTGLYLWWPKPGRLRSHLRVHAQPPARRWVTWHRSAGALLLPLLLLATVTGVGLIYGKGFQAALTAAFGGSVRPAPVLPGSPGEVRWPRALQLAQGALPDARISRVSVPKPDSQVITFRARAAGEWHPVGRSEVHVDAAGTRVLGVFDATAQPAGTRASAALYPLHLGVAGGLPLRCLTAAIGLLPLFLLVTGFLFWRRRTRR